MRVLALELENIRCFRSLSLRFERDVCLLFGMNGAGKSSILHMLAAALSAMPGVGTPMPIAERDLRIEIQDTGSSFQRERTPFGAVQVALSFGDQEFTIGRRLTRGASAIWTGDSAAFKDQIQQRVDERKQVLPVLALYPAHRGWRDQHHRDSLPPGRLAGYDGALDAGADVAHLRAWWRDQDHRREKGGDTPALNRIEEAVQRFIGGDIEPPVYAPEDEDILLDLPETNSRLCLGELSDGYRGMIALVADVARRMAQLNPDLGDAVLENTPGLVAIDELGLHLHPAWQRTVLPRLRRTFPQVQLVLTSHSPQVLASVEHNEEVISLSPEGAIDQHILPVVGRDSNAVLAEVMGDRVRPKRYQDKLDELYKQLDEGAFVRVRTIIEELEVLWGHNEPNLVRARRMLEIEEV